MLNKVVLQGRLTAHPELKTTQTTGTSVCSFRLAVDRSYKKEGSPTADFIDCVAWKNTAEFITRFFRKGQEMLVDGTLQVRTYTDQQGVKKYITEVLVLGVNFCGPKQQAPEEEQPDRAEQQEPRYQQAPASLDILVDEDLPF
jgi:single-strand DNA-binding protein